jgi:adenylate cyclase
VRKAGGRVRITAQLIDALSGTHLWADRFDGSLEDVFELQDRVAISVAGVIEPTLQAAEIRRSSERPTHDLTAHDLYLRALPLWGSYEREPIIQALDLLGRAIERDPHYGPALALAAVRHPVLVQTDWTDEPETNRRKGIDLARRALRFAPDDTDVLANSALVLGIFGEDIDVAIGSIDRSLALNPRFARGWVFSAVLRNFAGQSDIAIEHFKMSLRLSPRDRIGIFSIPLGTAPFFKRQFEETAAILLASLQEAPSFAVTYRVLASCYAHMGRLADAREMVQRLRAITPVVVPSVTPYRKLEHGELFLSGLRLAAGETT